MENPPITEENTDEIPSEKSTEDQVQYDKFTDSRFIRSKRSYFLYFILISSASIILLYFFTNVLRDSLLNLFLPNQLTTFSIFDMVVLYAVVNVLWDIFLLFALVNIINVITARILGIQVGRIFLITFISLVTSVLIFQLVIYMWFYFGDPIGLKNQNILNYIVQLYYYEEGNSSSAFNGNNPSQAFFNLIGVMGDFLFALFYKSVYIGNQSFTNYLILYAIGKGMASNVPYSMGDLGFNILSYEIFIEFGIYLLIFTLLFFKFVKPCTCITEETLDQQIADYESEELFNKSEAEGVELGKSVVVEKKGESINEWEVEK